MARKRLISPEFYTHDGLFEAERESGLPLRLAYSGLWTQADRRGVFAWRPLQLKLHILPFDVVDFAEVLEALRVRGFVQRYEDEDGRAFGWIPSFDRWQTFNKKEYPSAAPDPPKCKKPTAECAPAPTGHGVGAVQHGEAAHEQTPPTPPQHGADTVSAPTQHPTDMTSTGISRSRSTGTKQQKQQQRPNVAVAPSVPNSAERDSGEREASAHDVSEEPAPPEQEATGDPEAAAAEAEARAKRRKALIEHAGGGDAIVLARGLTLPARTREEAAQLPLKVPFKELSQMLGSFRKCLKSEELANDHQRIVACRWQQEPGEPPVQLDDAEWQLGVLWERWRFLIGEVQFADFKKRVKPMQQVHSFVTLWRSVMGWCEIRELASEREKPFLTIRQFEDRIRDAIELGSMPLYDADGHKTARLIRRERMD